MFPSGHSPGGHPWRGIGYPCPRSSGTAPPDAGSRRPTRCRPRVPPRAASPASRNSPRWCPHPARTRRAGRTTRAPVAPTRPRGARGDPGCRRHSRDRFARTSTETTRRAESAHLERAHWTVPQAHRPPSCLLDRSWSSLPDRENLHLRAEAVLACLGNDLDAFEAAALEQRAERLRGVHGEMVVTTIVLGTEGDDREV